mmetsp:Transcript_70822/g.195638  ORF Transcript_70822/g.195638 Transcript_70822/m.195638 type:complete len:243 (+) Transcript_70822:1268-1996(+)
MTAPCCSLRKPKASSRLSAPKTMVVAPPTGPRMVTVTSAAPSSAKQTDALPPGACAKRGAPSGVSTQAARCSSNGRKASLWSSLPRTTDVTPPTGPRALGPGLSLFRTTSSLQQSDALPPGACVKRGAASGVSMGAPRSSSRWLKTSRESSLPRTMVVAPPTAPLSAATAAWPSAPCATKCPARLMVDVPPGACRKRGAAAGVATAAPRCSSRSRKRSLCASSSLPRTTLAAPPTGPLVVAA